jgi:hypothetical protein
MTPTNSIRKFFAECFRNYLDDIRAQIPEFPIEYRYPDGNPVRPVLPIADERKEIILVGAFPSARFERRNGKLIPVGDNLSPFGQEKYFDGQAIRYQASRDILDEHYFPKLEINANDVWITDLVKVYLFPDKHISNCRAINPAIAYTNTHGLFPEIANASYGWLEKEIGLCQPKFIITLGEVVARVVSKDTKTDTSELLNGELRPISFGNLESHIAHLGHPEIWRRNTNNWRMKTENAITKLAKQLRENRNNWCEH